MAATSQTQGVAFTYPSVVSQQDLLQSPLTVAAQGAVLCFHGLRAVCFEITSLHFPLICDSRSDVGATGVSV